MEKTKRSLKSTARIAGGLGLIVLITGSLTHTFNSEIIDLYDAQKTVENFVQYESKYRLGFVCGLLMETVFVFYAFLLYSLFKRVNKKVATLMLILALIPAPLFYANQLNHFAAFIHSSQNVEEMLFYLELHKHGGYVISIFFGLWLFPLGYLVYKSTLIPRIIGILLMIGCFGYLISFVQGFLFPSYEKTLWTNPFLIVTHIAEIILMLWLLVKGVDEKRIGEMSSAL